MNRFIFIFWVLSVNYAVAQNNHEPVIVSQTSGDVSVSVGGNWQPLVENTKLSTAAIIKIRDGGSFTLIRSDSYAVIKKPGTYMTSVGDIIFKKYPTAVAVAFGVFYKYLISEQKSMGIPAVIKGIYLKYPMLFPANKETLLHKNVRFRWRNDSRGAYYFLLISDKTHKPVRVCMNQNINDTTITLADSGLCAGVAPVNNDTVYDWSIKPVEKDKTGTYFVRFTFADNNTADSLKSQLTSIAEIRDNLGVEACALLKVACFLKYNMYSEADDTFREVMSEIPRSRLLGDAYENFIQQVIRINQPKANNGN
jgi:hypothetical protein